MVVRRVAIDIAEACEIQALQQDLVTIALDSSQVRQIRIEAAGAVSRIGDEATKAKLKPLAVSTAGDDPDDELKAHGLSAVWPKHITIEELLTCITPPKRSDFVGAYQVFVQYELPKTITSADLLKAMNWAAQQPRYDKFHLIGQFTDAVMFQGWNCLDDPEILEAFLRIVLLRLEAHEEIFRNRLGSPIWRSIAE